MPDHPAATDERVSGVYHATTAGGFRSGHQNYRLSLNGNESYIDMILHTAMTILSSASRVVPMKTHHGLCSIVIFTMTVTVHAGPVRGVRILGDTPMVLRGGVMLVPLMADQGGDRWPRTLDLTLSDGRRVPGQVLWIHTQPEYREVRWTEDPRRLAVRAVQPADDSSTLPPVSAVGPFLVARMPTDVDGIVQLNQQVIRPRWIDLPKDFGRRYDRLPTLPGSPAADLPDTESPFEYWRWILLSQKLGLNAPNLSFNPVQVMVAEYYAGLWGAGIQRLMALDVRLGRSCLDHLTRVCSDRGKAFAAWEADPRRLGDLLSMLLELDRSTPRRLEQIRIWCEQREPILFWTEAEYPDHVRLAMVNTSNQEIITKFIWIHTPDVPSAVVVEPGVLMHVRIDRAVPQRPAPVEMAPANGQDPHVLIIDVAARQYRMEFSPRSISARPPGISFGVFNPPWSLGTLQTRTRHRTPNAYATSAHFRRREGQWEIFFECHRPRADSPIELSRFSNYEDVRHIESVTVLIGDESGDGGPRIALTVPESGAWRLYRGASDGSLEIHRRSYEDRWYCRIVLPDSWMLPRLGPSTFIGCSRSHADLPSIETAPRSGVPWRVNPGWLSIDLSRWTDRPDFEPSEEP